MKRKRRVGPRKPGNAWQSSAQWRVIASAAILDWNARRPVLPKCGARRKYDGGVCQQLALANGRCAWHGGRSPKGDAWGLPVWPNPDSPDVEKKLQRKLAERERAAKKRAVRLATMSTDQRKRHDAWHAARKPGSAAAREQARSDRRQATELRAMRAKPQPPPTREAADLESQIAALRAELEQRQPDNPKPIGAFS